MRNSSYSVFSVYQNTKTVIEKRKYGNEIMKTVHRGWYNKTKSYTVTHCKRIFNEIENGYYTYDDMVIHMLTESLFNTKAIVISKINEKTVKNTLKLYTKKRLQADKAFVMNVNKDVGLKSLKDFFEINEDGENLIYTLTSKEFISPAFYAQYGKKYLTKDTENTILLSIEYERFENINNIIIKFLKRRHLHAEEKVSN
jgi:hypothetical protein